MPKYRIHCSSTRHYFVDVEAPDEAAVDKYYVESDASEFTPCEDMNWELSHIEHLPDDADEDVRVDADGVRLEESHED